MNSTMGTDRFLRMAPLVLRLGISAVLLSGGVGQVSRMFGAETGESVLADNTGLAVNARWESVLGIAQVAVGGLLLLGLFTRLVSLAVLGGTGYGIYALLSATGAGADTAIPAAGLVNGSSGAMMLLAAACASLLFSGAGCMGLDCRNRASKRMTAVAG